MMVSNIQKNSLVKWCNLFACDRKQLNLALYISWLILSCIIFLILIMPFILPTAAILKITPKCEWKIKYNKPCPACGMTTSFLYISEGKFNQAIVSNHNSITLYILFLLNELIFLIISILIVKKYKKNLSYVSLK